MRNLKRALSLTLASVMLLGMMVTGAGAASFPDVDEDSHNIEAIEVLQAVDVMIGDENGNFGPDDQVNRAQMAVIMAKLLNLNYDYYQGADPGFWDVPSWAAPYVAACYANGIVSGYGNGQYGSADGVTAVQAASMMMRALGYFKYAEDYQDSFELATVHQGTEIGIFDGVGSQAGKSLTRNEVARMALNALESEMVTFTGTPGVTVGDVTVGYRAEYTPRTSTELKYTAIENRTSDVAGGNNLNRGQYYVQLGEELYNGKLTRKLDRDDFMRPSINWKYDGKEIGVYVDTELKVAEYTDEVKYSELYDLLTYSTIRDYTLDRYTDGVDQNEDKDNFSRSNKDVAGKYSLNGGSGRGVLTEVFVDQDQNEITITSINTWLAKANSDYNKNTDTLSLKIYTGSSGNKATSYTYNVESDDVAGITDVKKDDFKLVYLSGKNVNTNSISRYDVVKMFDTEILSESVITKFSTSGSKVVDKVTTNGTEYKTNVKAFYDKDEDVLGVYDQQLLTDRSYNLYMDRYDNVIGMDLFEGTRNYVFITGFDRGNSHISVKTADAAAIFLDGTMDKITVNVTETDKNIDRADGVKDDVDGNAYYKFWNDQGDGNHSENRWYTYTVNANGTYTLKPVKNMIATDYNYGSYTDGKVVLNSANLYVNGNGTTTWNGTTPIGGDTGRAYGEDASVYLTVDTGRVDTEASGKTAITDVTGVYTGIQDIKMEITADTQKEVPNAVYTVFDDDRYIIASIVVGEAQGATANYAYILSGVKSERYEAAGSNRASDKGTYYWEFDAFYNGEKQTLTAKTDCPSSQTDFASYRVQELRFDGEYVTSIKEVKNSKIHARIDTNEGIDDMDVYDVGRVATGGKWADGDRQEHYINATLEGHNGASANRLNGTIYLQGRTLYVADDLDNGTDVGLALAKDAPALLVQREYKDTNSAETRVYSSVQEAVDNIADKDPNTPGTQFRGRIVAALDGRGVARWVVLISDTTLKTGNKPNYDNGNTTVGNVTVYYSDCANISNRDKVSVNIDYYGDMTVAIPVDVKTGTAEISRITATVDGIYRPATYTTAVNAGQVLIHLDNCRLTGSNRVVITIEGLRVTAEGTNPPAGKDEIKAITVTGETSVKEGATTMAKPTVTADGTDCVVSDVTLTGTETAGTDATAKVTVTLPTDSNKVFANGVTYTSGNWSGKGTGSKTLELTNDKITVTANTDGISFSGSAVEGTDFTAVENEDGSYTITAKNGAVGVMVREVEGCTVEGVAGTETAINSAVFTQWTVTPSEGAETVSVKVNKMKAQMTSDGKGLISVEVENGRSSMGRMARAAVVTAETEEGGENAYFKVTFVGLTVDGVENPTYVMAKVPGVEGLRFGADFTTEKAEALLDALNSLVGDMGLDLNTEVTEEEKDAWLGDGEPENPDVPTGRQVMVLDLVLDSTGAAAANNTATISEYLADPKATLEDLTPELVAEALNKAAAKYKVTFKAENVNLTAKTATANDNTVVTLTLDTGDKTAKRVYLVKWPGGEKYAEAGASLAGTEVNAGITKLLDTANNYGTAVVVTPGANPATDKGTATLTVPAAAGARDMEYKDAVAIQSNGSGNDTTPEAVPVESGAVKDGKATSPATNLFVEIYDLAAKKWIPLDKTSTATILAGTQLRFSQPSATAFTAGTSVVLQMNGKDNVLSFSVGADKNFTEEYQYVEAPAGAELKLMATVVAGGDDTTYWVDGVDISESLEETDGGAKQIKVSGMTGLSLVYLDETGSTPVYKAIAAGATVDNLGVATVPLTSLASVAANEDGEIHLFRAYSVVSGTDWKAYTEYKVGGSNTAAGASVGSGELYVLASGDEAARTIYIEEQGHKILGDKDGKPLGKMLDGTSVAADTTNSDDKGVWAYVVNSNVVATSFKTLVEFKTAVNVTVNAACPDGASTRFTIANTAIKLDTEVKLTGDLAIEVLEFKNGTDELATITKDMIKVEKTSSSSDTIDVIITPDTDCGFGTPAAAKASAGDLAIMIGTTRVAITVKLAQS